MNTEQTVMVELDQTRIAARAYAAKSAALEGEAINFFRSIPTWARTSALREFLRRLAAFLHWQNLTKEL